MYILAFDTTAAQCAVILRQDDRVLEKFVQSMEFGQAEVLIPKIDELLFHHRLRFADIGLLGVCTGPGSFTGVRAGIAAARAFSIACPSLTVTGVSAFDAYLHSIDSSELAAVNAVIVETKREDFYFQLFDEKRRKITAPRAAAYADIIAELRNHKVSLAGDGVERFLNRPSGLSLHCIKMQDALPIEKLADCALLQYLDKRTDFPKPLYLRAPDVSAPKA